MVELGFVEYIQAGLGSASPPISVPGGFGDKLPENTIVPGGSTTAAWVYKTVDRVPEYVLAGRTGWTEWNVQIDCHGITKANAIALRQAIWEVLKNGLNGTFSDPDSTFVFQIFERDWLPSMFNDDSHTYVEAIEYQVIYQQT